MGSEKPEGYPDATFNKWTKEWYVPHPSGQGTIPLKDLPKMAHGGEIQSYNKQQSRKSTNIYNQARKFRR